MVERNLRVTEDERTKKQEAEGEVFALLSSSEGHVFILV